MSLHLYIISFKICLCDLGYVPTLEVVWIKYKQPDCVVWNLLDVFQVQEGLPAGSLLGTLHAKDPDEGENGTIFYSLSGKQKSKIFNTFSYENLIFQLVFLLPEDVLQKGKTAKRKHASLQLSLLLMWCIVWIIMLPYLSIFMLPFVLAF